MVQGSYEEVTDLLGVSLARYEEVSDRLRTCCEKVTRKPYQMSDSVPFARCRYARVSDSNAFDRRQHGRLCLHPNAVSGGILSLRRMNPGLFT